MPKRFFKVWKFFAFSLGVKGGLRLIWFGSGNCWKTVGNAGKPLENRWKTAGKSGFSKGARGDLFVTENVLREAESFGNFKVIRHFLSRGEVANRQ